MTTMGRFCASYARRLTKGAVMRRMSVLAFASLVVLAGCGTQKLHPTASSIQPGAGTGANHAAASTHSSKTQHAASGSTAASVCSTSGLSLRLGAAGHAAGSAYIPIVFTNTSGSSCTLTGYPGVSFVAPGSGHQVGKAASRNTQHLGSTVTLASGGSASALIQIANTDNFTDGCGATAASGLRVYPPDNKAAAYVAFTQNEQVCSDDVGQLSVESVVAGTAGM